MRHCTHCNRECWTWYEMGMEIDDELELCRECRVDFVKPEPKTPDKFTKIVPSCPVTTRGGGS